MRQLTQPVPTHDDQSATLDAVLRVVAEVAAWRHTPVVEIDLDLTALCPRERTRQALAAAGDEYDIPEFAFPKSASALLPGYTDEAWAAFLAASDLRAAYPDLPWERQTSGRSVFATFHREYWRTERLIEDEPTPGLGEFVRRVEDRGGRVVFLSGRWRVDQIAPSRAALQRAGIAAPSLLIGNPWHAENVRDGEAVWSDAQVKKIRQAEIRERYGVPVAVFDDRRTNREAVAAANAEFLATAGLPPVLGVAVTIPGFSHDQETIRAAHRISTFEGSATTGPDPRREPYLAARYPAPAPAGGAPEGGLLTGLGRNGRGYVLPRRNGGAYRQQPPSGYTPHFDDLARRPPGSLTDEQFMATAEATIPAAEWGLLDAALNLAEAEAKVGLAAPFPDCPRDRADLRHALACSWLHSRDLDVVMAAVGYPLPATGVHDLTECVPAEDVIVAISRALDRGARYSEWFLRWVQRLDRRGAVNVDFLNPNLTVGTWRWRADADMPQDAMDAHRVSAHHDGDGNARYDPVEATVNNLLHARESVYGVQKSPVLGWAELAERTATQVGAEAVAKSGWGGPFIRDAIPVVRFLEDTGYVMPWGVVGASPHDTRGRSAAIPNSTRPGAIA